MKKMLYLKAYAITLVVFLAIDFVWLSFVAASFYRDQIGFLLKMQPDIVAAFIFYAIFVAGLLYFVILPALKSKKISTKHVSLAAGFFGLVAYATYDLTNYSTIAGWPLQLVIVDMIWGTLLTALTAAVSFSLIKKL